MSFSWQISSALFFFAKKEKCKVPKRKETCRAIPRMALEQPFLRKSLGKNVVLLPRNSTGNGCQLTEKLGEKMKATGPTKRSTYELAVGLEKQGKKSKKAIWRVLSDDLLKQRRGKGQINIWQLNKLAKKFKGKMLVTSSKVLSFGEAEEKINIAATEFSASAKEKIEKAGGKAMSLKWLMESKTKESEMVLVK